MDMVEHEAIIEVNLGWVNKNKNDPIEANEEN